MTKEKVSKLQFYSLGIVAANKLLNSDIIEVNPIEEFPMMDGEITDNVEQYKTESKTSEGETFNTDIQTTVSVKAKWLPINNSNRRSSPDVRRGETVVIYRFADTDEYWWNTLKNDHTLRRLETVIYCFSNSRKENIADDANSTYWIEISTHKKLIHVHTSKNDNEPFCYDIQINAKDGNLVITDDAGNYILLDSKENTIHLENGLGSFVDINRTVITINANDININGQSSVTVNTNAMSVNSSSTVVSGSSSINITSPATSIN